MAPPIYPVHTAAVLTSVLYWRTAVWIAFLVASWGKKGLLGSQIFFTEGSHGGLMQRQLSHYAWVRKQQVLNTSAQSGSQDHRIVPPTVKPQITQTENSLTDVPGGTSPRDVKMTILAMTMSMLLTPAHIMYDCFHTMTEALHGSKEDSMFCKTQNTYDEPFQIKVVSSSSVKQVVSTSFVYVIWEYPNTEINMQKSASGLWYYWGPTTKDSLR